MQEAKGKRNVAVDEDRINNKVIIRYESTLEINPETVQVKIKQLESQIAHMEHHHRKMGMDIESAKKELQLLKQVNVTRG